MPRSKFFSKDFFVDPDIAKAEGLPPDAFTEPAFLEIEQERIFRKYWLLVPPETRDALDDAAGAQAPFPLLEQPLFLQSDKSKKLHVYPNVCTHAGYPLVHKVGIVERIVCGQHGRCFNLLGEARDPKFMSSALFPRRCDHLDDLPLAEWERLLFVALRTPRVSFDDVFAPMMASVAGLRVSKMRRVVRTGEVREVEGNWKQHAWNFMDSLHLPLIHKSPNGLVDALHFGSYKTELYDHSALQWAYATDPELGFPQELLPDRFRDPVHPERRVLALWWFVFPNMAFNFYPWGLSLNVYMPVAGNPLKTSFRWHHYVMNEKLYAMRERLWRMSKVDTEDIEAIGAAAVGLRSIFATRGLFAPVRETGPHWFHRRLFTAVFEE